MALLIHTRSTIYNVTDYKLIRLPKRISLALRKKRHSTDLCIFTVKSTIKYYNIYNSPVYSCFLDASNAYDRVNHWTLFKKLLKRSISVVFYVYLGSGIVIKN